MEDISMDTLCENAGYLKDDIDDLVKTTQSTLDHLAAREAESTTRIKDIINDLRSQIDDKERQLLALNKSEFLKCRAELQSDVRDSESLGRAAERLYASLDEACNIGQESNKADLKQRFESLESQYIAIQDRRVCPEFVVKPEDKQAFEDLQYGRFEYFRKFLVPEPAPSDTDRPEIAEDAPPPYSEVPHTIGVDFSSQTKYETIVPFPTSIIWVNRKIIITDKANHKVKFFWDVGDFLHEMTFLNSEPYGVCYIPQDNDPNESFAVTLPKQRKIYFISQTGGEAPTTKFDITTTIGYCDLVCIGKTGFAVTAVNIDFPRVDIINYQGEVVRSMAMDFMKQPLFSFPRYIEVDANVCIVSDWRQNRLTFIGHKDCSILGTYSGTTDHPLQDPLGVTVDGKGYIFVTDGKSGKIHVVDRNFQLVRMIEDTGQLLSARLLAFDSHTGRLAVTYAGGYIKSVNAPTAAPNYSQTSGREVPSAPDLTGSAQLMAPSDSHVRCPSPGF